MATSGTYTFALTAPDLVIEAFERLQIRGPALTTDHLISARRSINLVFGQWPNRGVNLWAVDLVSVPLINGVASYTLDSSTIEVLDCYLRSYQMGAPVNFAPQFSTTISTAVITVTQANHGFSVGQWITVALPVAIGGLILLGFYQVTSVLSSSQYRFSAASSATSSATGGTVPSFTTVAASTTVTVSLTNHGYLAGQTFPVQVSTTVGGITLQGDYTIATTPSANTFTITAPYAAGSSATVSENSGLAQVTGQVASADPIDRIMTSISRTDYASLPDKIQPGSPTVFWFDRTIAPVMYLWQVPDSNGPYVMQFYRTRRVQDVGLAYGQNLDMPPRFFEAACAETAAHLAVKWKPELADKLKIYGKEAWAEAAAEDRERVPMYLTPQFDSYFR